MQANFSKFPETGSLFLMVIPAYYLLLQIILNAANELHIAQLFTS